MDKDLDGTALWALGFKGNRNHSYLVRVFLVVDFLWYTNSMVLTSLLLIAGVFFANFLTLLIIRAYINRQKQAAIDIFHAYTDQRGEEPSIFTGHVDQISARLAATLVRSLKAQLMNMSALNTKQGKQLEGEAAVAAVEGTGGLGELAMSMPQVQQMVKKNPLLGILAQAVLSRGAAGQQVQKPVADGYSNNGHDGGMKI